MGSINRDYTGQISPDYPTNCMSDNLFLLKRLSFLERIWIWYQYLTTITYFIVCKWWFKGDLRWSCIILVRISFSLFWKQLRYTFSVLDYVFCLVRQHTDLVSTLHLVLFSDQYFHKSWEIFTLQWPVSDWAPEISPRRAPKCLSCLSVSLCPALSTLPGPGSASQARYTLSRAPARVSPSWPSWAGPGLVVSTNKRPQSSCRRKLNQSEAEILIIDGKTFWRFHLQ